VRDFVEVTCEVTIKHYRIHKLPDGSVYIARRSMFINLLLLVEHYQGTIYRPTGWQGRSDGGYIGIYTPEIIYLTFYVVFCHDFWNCND